MCLLNQDGIHGNILHDDNYFTFQFTAFVLNIYFLTIMSSS